MDYGPNELDREITEGQMDYGPDELDREITRMAEIEDYERKEQSKKELKELKVFMHQGRIWIKS
jgi:hypothetical protein